MGKKEKTHDEKEMPFLDHLEELRWRIMWSAGALIVAVGAAFFVMLKFDAIRFLAQPILPLLQGQKLITVDPIAAFKITMSASFLTGVVVASPVILFQLWAFLSPALHAHEKRVVIPVLIFGAVLFAGGVSLAYFGLIPMTLKMLLSVQSSVIQPMISVDKYFDFALSFALVMGLVFEMPIVVLALTALGVVTPAFLKKFRRHAFVVCIVASAFITPGQDPVSLAAVAVPLVGLYELSVICSTFIFRRRERKEREREAEEARIGDDRYASAVE
jgi:sec-independent protein translocase protein TatC